MVERAPLADGARVRPTMLMEEPSAFSRFKLAWIAAVGVAFFVHLGLFYFFTREVVPLSPPTETPPAAVMVDMAPEVQQAFSQNDLAVGQPMVEASEQPPPPPDPPPVDEIPNVESSPVEAVAPLPPKPPEHPKVPEPPAKERPKPTKEPPKPNRKQAARTASAPKSDQHAERTTASSAGASNSAATADWKTRVKAAIDRVKRFPPGAHNPGSPVISITMTGSGALVSVSIVASSGVPEIDSEALATVRRVGSFEAPPSHATITQTIRLNFTRR